MKTRAETVTAANRGSASVHTGAAADSIALPRIVVEAESGPEAVQDTGIFDMEASVAVYSGANETDALTTHRSRSAYVVDAFMQDNLADLLTADLADFHCLGIKNRAMPQTEREDDHWITRLRFTAVCCGSDLA